MNGPSMPVVVPLLPPSLWIKSIGAVFPAQLRKPGYQGAWRGTAVVVYAASSPGQTLHYIRQRGPEFRHCGS